MRIEYITDKVFEKIKELPRFRSLRYLDLSCGEGHLANSIQQEGCEVIGTHFIDEDYVITNESLLSNLNIVSNVDLGEKLPFADDSFDVVIMTEVLEHLENHFIIIQEASRIIKEGGYLIFTTPNVYRLHSRLEFLFTGRHKLIRRGIGRDISKINLHEFHINMVDFPLLDNLLFQEGLGDYEFLTTKVKIKHFYVLPIFLWNYFFVNVKLLFMRIFDNEKNRANIYVDKALIGIHLNFSEQLAIVAKKTY